MSAQPRVLVVCLDGYSFIFGNIFLFNLPNCMKLFNMGYRRMLYIDDIPNTPVAWNTIFTGKYHNEHGVYGFSDKGYLGKPRLPYVWDVLEQKGYKVIVANMPVKLPAVWKNVEPPMHWFDCLWPPKERLPETCEVLHQYFKSLACREWNLLVVWYPIPDQAHHHYFPTLETRDKLEKAFQWYDLSCRYAVDLIEASKPTAWIVLSDHGMTNTYEEIVVLGKKQGLHNRDGLVVASKRPLPEKTVEVYGWILRWFGEKTV